MSSSGNAPRLNLVHGRLADRAGGICMGNFHHGSVLLSALGVRRTEAQERLAASLGASDQKMPIVVVATGQAGRGLVIEGHLRIGTLELLVRDTVDAVIWRLSNAKALLLDRPSSWGRTGHRARTRLVACGPRATLRLSTKRSWRVALIAAPAGCRAGDWLNSLGGAGSHPRCTFGRCGHLIFSLRKVQCFLKY